MRAFCAVLTLWVAIPCLATPQNSAQEPVNFLRDVQPIFQSHCLSCHNGEKQMHGLRLDRRADALKGGDSGVPAFVPGKSSESLMVKYVAGLVPNIVMPPFGPRLSSDQIDLLRRWIDQGAEWEAEISTAQAPRLNHWAFQPRSRPAVPAIKQREWVRNPLDAFILAKLETKGWKPAPPAKPLQLLRRVYLDLIGLPPSLVEQEAFLKDSSPEALDQVVNGLLAQPAYGERWARHWLDLVRYAETNGYERDATKPQVWKYRDYVIRSFNQDKPFNRFVLEQLAGDELSDLSEQTLIATGYYRLGPWDDEPADPIEDRFDQLDDFVSTTSQAFLGLTLGCARCHNHKFEPLTAQDYYSMVAIFNGLERPRDGRTELDLPLGTRQQLVGLRARDEKIGPLEKEIAQIRDAFRKQHLESGKSSLFAEAVKAFLTDPKQRSDEQQKLVKQLSQQLEEEVNQALPEYLRQQISRREEVIAALRRATPDLPRGYFLHEETHNPPATHLLIRGKARQPGPEVFPAVPAVLTKRPLEFPPSSETSLRRLTLAKWVASPENPLTARIIVNRIWQHHFGEGLVRTSSDFGVMGEKPAHLELLDWLANWFVEQGWSFKKLHRLILSSNTYRMSKQWGQYGGEDPENRAWWRFPYTRLEVEAIRDSMLAVSGQLNRRMYGPSMFPEIPAAALQGHSDPDKIWKTSLEEERSRRTIYSFIKRSMIVPMLEVLDLCDTTRTTAKRTTTSVAPQALTLLNGEFVNQQARHFAGRLLSEAGNNPEYQITLAYRLALVRPATFTEQQAMLAFLTREEKGLLEEGVDTENARIRALEEMCRVIFNLNEFVYTD